LREKAILVKHGSPGQNFVENGCDMDQETN